MKAHRWAVMLTYAKAIETVHEEKQQSFFDNWAEISAIIKVWCGPWW